MSSLSSILYFLTRQSELAVPLFLAVGFVFSFVLVSWRRNKVWYLLILPFFLMGLANVFTARIWNALFLERFGTDGTAVITQTYPTGSTLNHQPVWGYVARLTTADQRNVTVQFDTLTASTYPISNEIVIPAPGERFAIRYVTGFPANFVIMESAPR
jgi:hypothetical protein